MKLGSWLSLAFALLALPLAVSAQQPPSASRAITIDDLFQIREVQDPQLSPDAQWVAYTVKTATLKDDKSEERTWMVRRRSHPDDRGPPVFLTASLEP